MVINLWNSLPSFVVNSSFVLSFKANVDSYWINQEFYYKCDIAGTENRNISNKLFIFVV